MTKKALNSLKHSGKTAQLEELLMTSGLSGEVQPAEAMCDLVENEYIKRLLRNASDSYIRFALSTGHYADKIKEENINNIKIEEKFEIGDLQIKPFAIPHDAANPCGFNIFKGDQKISIATDIGHMTNGILKNLEDSIFVLLESNYDPEVLKFSRYPYILKSRIAGPNGHLPNETAGKTSNFPELAYKTVIDEIISNSNYNENSLKLNVASRDVPGTRFSF